MQYLPILMSRASVTIQYLLRFVRNVSPASVFKYKSFLETRVLYYSCTSSGGLTFCSDCAVPIIVLLLTVLMVG